MARPSIINDALIARFCSNVRISGSVATAIQATGIARETYYGWARRVGQGGGTELEQKFMAAIELAVGETKLIYERMFRQHIDKNWRAAAWWLESMLSQRIWATTPVAAVRSGRRRRTAKAHKGFYHEKGTLGPPSQSGTRAG